MFIDIAFEGLIRNVERRYRETVIRDNRRRNMRRLCRSRLARTVKGQRLKAGRTGSNRRREKYL